MKKLLKNIRQTAAWAVLGAAALASPLVAQPTVEIVYPGDLSEIPVETVVPVRITASDSTGLIDEVRILLNDQVVIEYLWNGDEWVFDQNYQVDIASPRVPPFQTDIQVPSTGVYRLRAEVASSGGGSATTPEVSLTAKVAVDTVPFVDILAPIGGSRFLPGTTLPVVVDANVAGALISEVEFLLNDVIVAVAEQPPYIANISLPSSGDYVLTARAISTDNRANTSNPITLTAEHDTSIPKVYIDHPLPLGGGDTVNDVSLASSMFLNAVVEAGGGPVPLDRVEFLINGYLLGTAESSIGNVYSRFFTPYASGPYSIMAIVNDEFGNAISYSVPLPLDVGPLERPLPVGEVVAPPSQVALGRDVALSVSVEPNLIPVDRVDFFANGVLIGSTVTPLEEDLFGITWTPGALGNYDIQARLVQIDPAGGTYDNWFITPAVSTTVVGSIPDPSVDITLLSPMDGGNFMPGTSLPIAIELDDVDGLIDEVRVSINGELLTTFPVSTPGITNYATNFVLPDIGVYEVQAFAVNSSGVIDLTPLATVTAGAHDETMPRVYLDHPLPLGGGDTVNDVSVASSMFINAVATDGDGLITAVNFFVNGVFIGTASNSLGDVYSIYFDPGSEGVLSISAQAVDNDGKSAMSVPLLVQVGPLERELPEGYVFTPGDTAAVGQAIGLFAFADGGLIGIDRVDFYANGVLIGSTVEPVAEESKNYGITWVPDVAGAYDIQARFVQIDPAGAAIDNWYITSPTPVTINPPAGGEVPIVELVTPIDGYEQTNLNPIVMQVSADNPWGSIDRIQFFSNGALVGEDTTYPYAFTFKPTSPGLYRMVALMVTDTGAVYQSDVNQARVRPATALPTVTITNPEGSPSVTVGTPILLTAEATSLSGANLDLNFYVNGVLFGTDSSYPYNQLWAPQSTGTFTILIEAVDPNTGSIAASDQTTVTVTQSDFPTAVITQPADGTVPTVGSDVLIEVDASDADGFIQSVQFFVNGQPLSGGVDGEEPFATFWRPGSTGTYELSALVIDNAGKQTVAYKDVTVGEPVGVVPRVTLSVTASGNVTPGSRIMVRANVFDDDPDNIRVLFFMNGALVHEDVEPPYSAIIDPETVQGFNFYELAAVAFDSDGNSRADLLAPLWVSDVTQDQPAVEITSLDTGDNLTEGSRAPIRVAVSGGAVPNIASVVFYANGVEIGRDAPDPAFTKTVYSFDWIPAETGTVELTAATLLRSELFDHDNDQDPEDRIVVTPVNVSSPVNVTVNPRIGNLPSISLNVLPQSRNLAIGSKVLLYADAQDIGGGVAQVEFFKDGVSLGAADTEAPFLSEWIVDSEGEVVLYAIATDTDGNVVPSSYVDVDVAARVITLTPEIDLTVPASGQEGSILSLRASTGGFVNPPEAIVFYANGQPIGESTTAPYNLSWLANLDGDVTFFATAKQTLFDGTLVTTVSNVVVSSLTPNSAPVIDSVDVLFPFKSVSKPDPLAGETLTFTIAVSDTGPIRSVELLRDGAVIAVSGNSATPFEVTDMPPGLGSYNYSILVTDFGGLQTQSAAIPVQVVVGESPIVAVTAPAGASTFPQSSPVVLRATASDPDGVISGVTFFVNGTPISPSLTSVPYQFTYEPPAPGAYEVTARARDNSGNLTESAVVNFTVLADNPPQFVEFSNNLPGSIARLNQEVIWTMDATDDNGLVSVKLFRDGTEIESFSAIPLELTDTITSIGRYRYFAEATDTAGNVTRSPVIEVTSTRGTAPVVTVTSPIGNTSYNLAEPVSLRASATAAAEPADQPAGSVVSVEFFLNGISQGVDLNAPYAIPSINLQEGNNVITAIATSDTGLTAESAEVLVFGVDGAVPEIISFTSDATSGSALVGAIINFAVEAFDENGIEEIQLLLEGSEIASGSGASVTFTFSPDESGLFRFRARAINVNGLQAESSLIEINVRYPDPVGSNSDFVLQTFLDLLMRNPTAAEQANFANRLDSGDLTRDRFVRELINPADGLAVSDYDAVRGALLANRLLLGQWPSRDDLEGHVGIVTDVEPLPLSNETQLQTFQRGLASLVSSLMIDFDTAYRAVDPLGVPDTLSSIGRIQTYITYLWNLKYGVNPTSVQLALASNHFTSSGRDIFTASFLDDVEVITKPNNGGYLTSKLGFQFPAGSPPSDVYLREADAASLLINFLQIVPTDAEVTELSQKLFATQVKEVVEDDRYVARFSSTFSSLQNFGNGWKYSNWLGYFSPANSTWAFHEDLGWIAFSTTGGDESNFWFYDRSAGWVWTRWDLYPVAYRASSGRWVQVTGSSFKDLATTAN